MQAIFCFGLDIFPNCQKIATVGSQFLLAINLRCFINPDSFREELIFNFVKVVVHAHRQISVSQTRYLRLH